MRARSSFPFESSVLVGHNQLFPCSWVEAFGVLVISFLLLESQCADWRESGFVFVGGGSYLHAHQNQFSSRSDQ